MTGDDLLAAVYAAPDDDAPRAVYADWLQQRGDPLGELIALQLAPVRTAASRKREATLIRRHAQRSLGEVWHVVNQKRLVFERGFLADARLVQKVPPPRVNAAIGDLHWATLHTLDLRSLPHRAHDLVLHDVLRNLRRLLATPASLAHRLLTDERPRNLQTLELDADVPPSETELREALRSAPGLPDLRHLRMHGSYDADPEQLAWFWDSPLAHRLEALELRYAHPSPAWRTSTAIPPNITVVYFGEGPLDLTTLRRGPSGLLDQLEESAR